MSVQEVKDENKIGQEEKKGTTKKWKKVVLILAGISVGIVITIYLSFSWFFSNRYYFGTIIGNISCGGMTAGEVKNLIANQMKGYTLTIEGREGAQELLTALEIGLEYVPDDTPEKILDSQNPFLWISYFWQEPVYEMPLMVRFDEDSLNQRFQEMPLLQRKNMRKPKDAYIAPYNGSQKCYPVIPEDPGTVLNIEIVKEAVKEAIEHLETTISLEEIACYQDAEIRENDKKLQRVAGILNRYVSTEVIYDWNGTQVTVDGDIIYTWLIWNEKGVRINEEIVQEFVKTKAAENDTYNQRHLFTTTAGETLSLKGSAFGWKTDQAAEVTELLRLVRAGEKRSREPVYMYEGRARGKNDIGNSYVEIDLGNQHLYLYVEGRKILESDLVSGNVSRGYTTPPGVFGLTYKTQNAVLRGADYETPVKYWMPFNGNIGMHDATWRSKFGGKIYLTGGSHGCINLPKKIAEEIYEYVNTGFPVICYY